MRSAAPTIRYLLRVAIFTASVALFVGWLAAPETLRAGREAAASYVPLPVEAISSPVAPELAHGPTPQGMAAAVALASLLVLMFGFGVPRPPLDREAKRPPQPAPAAFRPAPAQVLASAGVGRRVSRSFAFVLALGLFLGWMSAPDFVRRHEVSVAALGSATDDGRSSGSGVSSRLMDGFSSWIGPVRIGDATDPLSGMPAHLLEAIPQTTDLLDLEVFEDAETLLADLEETETARPAALADEGTTSPAGRGGERRAAERAPDGASPDRGTAPPASLDGADSPVLLAASPNGSPTTGGDAPGAGAAPAPEPAAAGDGGPSAGPGGQNPPGQDGDNSSDDGDRQIAGLVDVQPLLGDIFVRFEEAAEGTAIADLLNAIGGEISQCFDVIDDCVVRVSEALDPLQLVQDLRNQPTVAAASPNWVRLAANGPRDTLYPLQWSLHDPLLGKDINAPKAWAAMDGVSGRVKVAILDTAVDTLHPDLSAVVARVHTLSGGIGSLPDHGTQVAGIFAAQGDSFGITGVNRSWAELHVFDVFSTVTIGPTIGELVSVVGAKDSTIIQAIDAAKAVGVRVANLSFSGGPPSDPLCGAISGARNVLFVAAAGNGASSSGDVYPANCPGDNIVAVGSLDRTGQVALTSNRGGWVDVTAPGELILTTAPGASYVVASGTSMAAPHVSGVASMILAKNPGYGASTVRDILIGSTGKQKRLDACKALGGSC